MSETRRLGRGLEALLGPVEAHAETDQAAPEPQGGRQVGDVEFGNQAGEVAGHGNLQMQRGRPEGRPPKNRRKPGL